jgi:hypothetical protein
LRDAVRNYDRFLGVELKPGVEVPVHSVRERGSLPRSPRSKRRRLNSGDCAKNYLAGDVQAGRRPLRRYRTGSRMRTPTTMITPFRHRLSGQRDRTWRALSSALSLLGSR